MLAEAALGMPALVVERAVEAFAHAPPIWRLRPASPGVAPVEADDRAPDTEFFATEPVIVLGIVASVAQDGSDRNQPPCLPQGGSEVGRVLARPNAGDRAQDEVGGGVEDGGQLRPGSLSVALSGRSSHAEVGTDVTGLQSGGIDRGDRLRTDQAARPCSPDHRGLGVPECPPASASARIRREAWASVE